MTLFLNIKKSAFAMRKSLHLLAVLLAVSCAYGVGCNSRPSPGIEAGNPNVSVKSIRVLPKDGDEIYEVTLLDETDAAVSQIQGGDDPTLLDEVIVPYQLKHNILNVEAAFGNERAIGVTASFGVGGETVSGVLKVDGGFAEACFEVPGQSPSCDADDEAAPGSGPGDPTSDPIDEPSPAPTTVILPITRGDTQESHDEGILTSPLPSPSESRVAPGHSPYGPYCTLIDGRPACLIPPFGEPIVDPTPETRPFLQRADGIRLSRVPVFLN